VAWTTPSFSSGNGATVVNRADFQRLAKDRIRDAEALLRAKRWGAAYYLAGYAVECGLKSCVIRRLMITDLFPERKFSEQCWTHGLAQLLGLAGLKADMAAADPDLQENWDIAKDWRESSRYARTMKDKAEALYDAIADKKQGVLAWIKGRW
jgi:HEPN domain-containing protein